MEQTSKFCQVCRRQTLFGRPATNHILHLLVTLFLCGLWIPIWILASIKIGGWRCQTCGYQGSLASRLLVPVAGVGVVLVGLCMLPVVLAMLVGGGSATPVVPVATSAPAKPKPEMFTAVRGIVCATDPKFLDSTALIAPARFVRVEPGTQVVRVGFGGMTSKLYWELSAGGRERIYVYKDDFNRNFQLVVADPVTAPGGGQIIDGITVKGFDAFYVEIKQHDEIVECEVTFRKLPPTADIAESVVRSAMQAAIKKHPNQEILGMAFNLNGDTLPDEQYGGAVTYKPGDKQILTMRERDGLETIEQDQGEYLVQVEENKTATGIKPIRRWLTVAIVFAKSPSENDAKIAAINEIEKLKARRVDMTVYIHTGEKSNKITWRQTPAPNGKVMFVEYNNATGVIVPNWNWVDLPGLSSIKPEKPETTRVADPTQDPKPIIVDEPEPAKPNVRTWTSADGKFTTEAGYDGMVQGKVKLRKADGTTVTVPITTLSKADREWIKGK